MRSREMRIGLYCHWLWQYDSLRTVSWVLPEAAEDIAGVRLCVC
jgi:hypothetical protein